MQRIKYIGLILLLSLTGLVKAQTYPITAFVNLTPPYSSYLPDYADPFNNQLKVLLTLNDFTVPSYQVKVRFKFEGAGYTITTADLLSLPPITVTPGVPVELTGNDLLPYLSTSNLVFSGIDVADYETRKVLPEGPCSICVEVVDYSNPNQSLLGNPACAQAWFSLNDPPLLNTPFCGNQVASTDPQNILFSWTPLSMGSPFGMSTEYVFELYEIRPDDADPNMTVTSTLPIYTTTTTSTLINYGIIEPQLQLGMDYVWRVQAREMNGRDIYRNQGYSAVCTFTYGNIAESLAEGIELELNADGIGPRIGKAYWNANSAFSAYVLECRKTGNPDYAWFPFESTIGEITVNSLEPETEYECRVKGLIGSEFESEWSNTALFTTLAPPEYACGSTALPGKQETIIPLTNLMIGNFVSYGQFDMMITALDESTLPGRYKGYGKIWVPFTLTSFPVKFDDILVDANYMVREGRADALTDGLGALINMMEREFVNGVIDDVEVDTALGTVTVYFGDERKTFNFPENGGPLVIEDSSGLIFIIDPDGSITYDGNITIDPDVLAATENYQIRFDTYTDQIFGFDKLEHLEWREHYGTIVLGDGKFYHVPYKSTGTFQADKVLAIFRTTGSRSGIDFKTASGTSLTYSTLNDSTYLVDLPEFSEDEIVYGYDGSEKIGKLNVKVYEEKVMKVTIVPLLGATVNETYTESINAIFKQANASLDIVYADVYENTEWDLNGDGLMEAPVEVGLMNKYSEEMRALRDAYFNDSTFDKTSVYIFIAPGFDEEDLDGYMVRGKGMGFVTSSADAQTYAHEISHGLFGLSHTFHKVEQGSTRNLMDYAGTSANRLTAEQWDAIHSPLPTISFLDDEEDGSLYKDGTHVTKICHPYVLAQVNTLSVFYAPDNSLVDLSTLPGAKANRFYDNQEKEQYAYGTLNGFIYNGKQYRIVYDSKLDNPFIGYAEENSIIPIEIIPRESLTEADGTYVKIDCSSDSIRFFNHLNQLDSKTPLFYECDYCHAQIHNEFFVEGNPDFVEMYMSDKEEAGTGTFGRTGDLYLKLRDEISNKDNLSYVDEQCQDRIKAFSIYNQGREFKIIPYYVNNISRKESDWHLLAKSVFEASNLDEDDILITLPFHVMTIGNLEYTYFMPGLAYGNKVVFDETSLKAIQFDNMISKSDDAVRDNGNIIDFINHVFKNLKKKVIINEAVLLPNASISFHTYEDTVYGYQQNCYLKLFKNNAFDQIIKLEQEYQAEVAYRNSLAGDKYAINEIVELKNLDDKYEKLLFKTLVNADPLSISEFTPRESDRFNFKDEFLGVNAEDYAMERAFIEYFQVLNSFDFNVHLPDYEEPLESTTWNRENYGWQILDNMVYTSLDVTGVVLGFVGLDIITDGLGFAYASCRGDVVNSSLYGVSVFIIGVPSIAPKIISKSLVAKGSKNILRIAGTEIIGESIEDVVHFYRFKYKVNGELTAEEVLKLVTYEKAGKMDLNRTADFMSASENPVSQRKILEEIGEEISAMFSFLDELNWELALKETLQEEIEITPDLMKLFDDADLENQIDLAEAWKVLHDAGVDNVIRRNIDELNLVHANYDEIVDFPGGYNAWKAANSGLTGIQAVDDFLALAPKIDNISPNSVPVGYQVITKNGSKYIRRADASNPNTPRLMVDHTGTIVPYVKPQRLSSNGLLRTRLVQANGGVIPDGHQAHHLVPDNVVQNSPIHQEAISRGLYDIDRVSNGKLLAETAEDYVPLSDAYPTHFGSHPNYDDAIKAQIDDLIETNNIDIFDLGSLNDTQIEAILNAIENRALDVLTNWQPSKLN